MTLSLLLACSFTLAFLKYSCFLFISYCAAFRFLLLVSPNRFLVVVFFCFCFCLNIYTHSKCIKRYSPIFDRATNTLAKICIRLSEWMLHKYTSISIYSSYSIILCSTYFPHLYLVFFNGAFMGSYWNAYSCKRYVCRMCLSCVGTHARINIHTYKHTDINTSTQPHKHIHS